MRKILPGLALMVCLTLAAVVAFAVPNNSWLQINQDLARPANWQSFVGESAFALGEREEAGAVDGKPIYRAAYGTYPVIDGSTVAVPMAMEFARQHLGLPDEDLSGFVFFSTTHAAYTHLIGKQPNGASRIDSLSTTMDEAQPVDLIIATEPSDEELQMAKDAGVTLISRPVCYDAFVFITHVDNPVNNLTVEQIRKIYGGQIINWKEVGGADSAIFPYQREPNSGSQTAMIKLVMQGRPLDGAEPNYVTEGMSDLIRRVGDYENSKNSLGYTYLYYMENLYRDAGVKVLSVDGIAPTPENLRSGAYPFTANYFGVIRGGEEQGTGGLFLDWMLTEEGQRAIGQAGYIPMLEVE